MSQPSTQKIAVIGAGPAGLAAALKLAQAGCKVDLYESQAEVGGLCRSLTLWGHQVDLGPHRFFSQSEKVNRLWFALVGMEYAWVRRQTRIFYKKRYFNYPLQALNTFFNLGVVESFVCLFSYLRQKMVFEKKTSNFENWVVSRFGQRLYQIFFKTYSEKLWGLPCTEIDSDFADRKIRRLTFFEVLKKFLSYKKTHVEFFAYPHKGTGSVYKRMAEKYLEYGGELLLNTRVESVKIIGDQVQLESRHRNQIYDRVISTMPLPQLIRTLPAPEKVVQAARSLKFRNTVLVYLLIEGVDHFTDNWIYVHAPEVDFGRVTNFKNWSSQMNPDPDKTVLCLEYWCDEDDELWIGQDSALIANASQGLERSGIIKGLKVIAASVYRLPKSYPVFKMDYKDNLSVIMEYLHSFKNVCSIGRNGAFSYNNQDHSILMGMEAAESVLRDVPHVASKISSSYEEDGEIRRFELVEEI